MEAISYGLVDYHAAHADKTDHIVLLGGNIVAIVFSCEDARALVGELEVQCSE